MGMAYIRPINPAGPLMLVEIIELSPGSPPQRPTPGPTPPPVDPNLPHPEHPIMLPGMPGWGLPGTPITPPGPVDPGYSPPWAQVPGELPVTPGPGVSAIVMPMPEGAPPATPPEGMPAGSVQVLVWFGKGTKPAVAWVGPYASTGPVPAPA
jgi:hypothetical protein